MTSLEILLLVLIIILLFGGGWGYRSGYFGQGNVLYVILVAILVVLVLGTLGVVHWR